MNLFIHEFIHSKRKFTENNNNIHNIKTNKSYDQIHSVVKLYLYIRYIL